MNSQNFDFRPVTAADKTRLLEISAKIWEGNDYLPLAFDSWLADQHGNFTACIADGQLIGCGKLSFIAPGHAWLEGLRKDIDSPIKGVGKAICHYQLSLLKGRKDLRSIRFATYILDSQSIHLNESIGFERIATGTVRSKCIDPKGRYFDAKEAPPLEASVRANLKLAPSPDPSASWLRQRNAGWLMPFAYHAWKAIPADTPERFAAALEAISGGCLDCVDPAGRQLGSLSYGLDSSKRLMSIIGLEAESKQAALALVYAAEELCRQAGFPDIEAVLPDRPEAFEHFTACHYQAWEANNDFLVYEFPLAKLATI